MEPPSEAVIRRVAYELGADDDELINLAGKVPKGLKAVLDENPEAVELLRVLSEQRLPDETYRQMLDVVRKAQSALSTAQSVAAAYEHIMEGLGARFADTADPIGERDPEADIE